jgi:hypothetical protein
MQEAKALRHVELLARITVTFENVAYEQEIVRRINAQPVELGDVLRELRLALVELDIARSENAPSIYEDGR